MIARRRREVTNSASPEPETMNSSDTTSNLLDLAVRGRWRSVVGRAETHPDELSTVAGDDGTVFHLACANDAPSQVLQALLLQDEMFASRGHSRAVFVVDDNGITPLMIACQRGSSRQHVELLVKSAPELIPLTDKDGWNALHYACSKPRHFSFSMDILPFLLSRSANQNRELALQRNHADSTPLSFASRDVAHPQPRTDSGEPFILIFVTSLIDLMLPLEQQSWPPMTKVLTFQQEVSSVFYFLALQHSSPASLLLVDNNGNTPLHFVVSSPRLLGLTGLYAKRVAAACPQAATVRNNNGLLPLQLALATSNERWNEDLHALVDANPAAIEALGLDDAIYSYLLARVNRKQDRPDTVFRILQSRPTLVRTRLG